MAAINSNYTSPGYVWSVDEAKTIFRPLGQGNYTLNCWPVEKVQLLKVFSVLHLGPDIPYATEQLSPNN